MSTKPTGHTSPEDWRDERDRNYDVPKRDDPPPSNTFV